MQHCEAVDPMLKGGRCIWIECQLQYDSTIQPCQSQLRMVRSNLAGSRASSTTVGPRPRVLMSTAGGSNNGGSATGSSEVGRAVLPVLPC
jgi:hypothetical protein